MKCREAVRAKAKLDGTFDQLSKALKVVAQDKSLDFEVQSHLSRYLCVSVSAFLEVSLRAILAEHSGNRSTPEVAGYVESQLGGFFNAKTHKVFELLGKFRPQWRIRAEQEISDEVKDAVNSVVDNKNKIAHGEPSGISFSRISEYYKGTVKFLEKIENIME